MAELNQILWTLDNEIQPRDFERLCVDLHYSACKRQIRPLLAFLAFSVFIAWIVPSPARAQQINFAEFRTHFLELCDRAAAKIEDPDSKGPYFVDS